MIELNDLCISIDQTVHEALKQIDNNAQGVLFVVDNGILQGLVTDGDIRRSLITNVSLDSSIRKVVNKNCVALHYESSQELVQSTLNERIKIIPLIDEDGKVVDYASIYRLHRVPVLEPLLGGNELEYVSDCVKTNWISSQGRYVQRFEDEIKQYTGANYVLAVSNGTVALHLALVALGIGVNDEVIVPNLTFGATLNAIILSGAKPVIVDVDKIDWNISIKLIEDSITPNTKAIMPVHIYGVPCKMSNIVEISKRYNLRVIEDCAEALGSRIANKHVGTFGDAGTFSFFGNKVITCGEGGAVIFRDRDTYEKAKVLRDHGMKPEKRYWHEVVGFNYRLTNLQAAIGCAQLEQLPIFREKREKIFIWYSKYLISSGFFEVQEYDENIECSYWLFTVKLKEHSLIRRDELIEKLAKVGIDTRPVFYPMSSMPAFKDFKNNLNGNSCLVSWNSISFPTSVYLSEEDIRNISIETIKFINSYIQLRKIEKSV